MVLSEELISEFVKVTNDKKEEKGVVTVYGTVKNTSGSGDDIVLQVQLDGADENVYTPVASTVSYSAGDRVIIQIKDHTAVAIGNITDNAVTKTELNGAAEWIFEQVDEGIRSKVSLSDFESIIEQYNNIIATKVSNDTFNSTIQQQSDRIDSKVSSDTFNSTIQQQSNLINSKVSSDTFNSTIQQQSNRIDSKVSSNEVNSLISQYDASIKSQIVLKGKVVSEINQSTEGIKISADRIELSGQTIFESIKDNENFKEMISSEQEDEYMDFTETLVDDISLSGFVGESTSHIWLYNNGDSSTFRRLSATGGIWGIYYKIPFTMTAGVTYEIMFDAGNVEVNSMLEDEIFFTISTSSFSGSYNQGECPVLTIASGNNKLTVTPSTDRSNLYVYVYARQQGSMYTIFRNFKIITIKTIETPKFKDYVTIAKDGTTKITGGLIETDTVMAQNLLSQNIVATGDIEFSNGKYVIGNFDYNPSTNSYGPALSDNGIVIGAYDGTLSLISRYGVLIPYGSAGIYGQNYRGELFEYLNGNNVRRGTCSGLTYSTSQGISYADIYFGSRTTDAIGTTSKPPTIIVSQVYDTANIVVLQEDFIYEDIACVGFRAKCSGNMPKRSFGWIAFGF